MSCTEQQGSYDSEVMYRGASSCDSQHQRRSNLPLVIRTLFSESPKFSRILKTYASFTCPQKYATQLQPPLSQHYNKRKVHTSPLGPASTVVVGGERWAVDPSTFSRSYINNLTTKSSELARGNVVKGFMTEPMSKNGAVLGEAV
ncbi:hypothetical protein RRG08_054894 [Elysia crispata]|uniref:Uncharacterized protein n=1 Tax=Elysia crispata TaxID=231223 RepID=A0AAE1A5R0_9GAST|nr:hypothetical protein RRG08_054894 [Elysia crispata]